jgi:hypothetical protein
MGQTDKRFVIQEHTRGNDVHWDFMLEFDETLQTYRLEESPEKVLDQPVNAVRISDHPLKFLAYQGSVNKGQGNVRTVETGTYKKTHQRHNRVKLSLNGRILRGHFSLTHITDDNWLFSKDRRSLAGT